MIGKISNRHDNAQTVIDMNNELIILRQENINLKKSIVKMVDALHKIEDATNGALNAE